MGHSRKNISERNYLSLDEAAKQLGQGYEQKNLLNRAIAGEFNIYAPILAEGKYVWPVTNRGIAHSRIMGDAEPVFTARFKRGEYIALHPQDIQDIQQDMDVTLHRGINLEVTLNSIEAWEEEKRAEKMVLPAPRAFAPKSLPTWLSLTQRVRKVTKRHFANQEALIPPVNKSLKSRQKFARARKGRKNLRQSRPDQQIQKLAKWYLSSQRKRKPVEWSFFSQRMRKLAMHVPWELSDPWVTAPENPSRFDRDSLIIRVKMLRVSVSEIQRLRGYTSTTISSESSNPPVFQHKTGKPGRRAGIETEIIQAQAEAQKNGHSPNDSGIIWGILTRMSENSVANPKLKGFDNTGILYASPNGTKRYTRAALNKFLKKK